MRLSFLHEGHRPWHIGDDFLPNPGDWVFVAETPDKHSAVFWRFTHNKCDQCDGFGTGMDGKRCMGCWGSGYEGETFKMVRGIMGYEGPDGEIPENVIDLQGQPVQI